MDCPSREEILESVNGTRELPGLREHVATCASCRASYEGMMAATEVLSTTPVDASEGRCLSDSQVIGYVRRRASPERERAIEEHLSSCAKCRDGAVDLAEALGAEPEADVPHDLERRILELVPRTARQTTVKRFRADQPQILKWSIAAAAGIFIAILLFLSMPSDEPVDRAAKKNSPPKSEKIVKEEPKKETATPPEAPPKEEKPKVALQPPQKPDPLIVPPAPKKENPTAEVPPPPPKEDPKKEENKPVVENPPKKEESKPAAETKAEVKIAKYLPVKVLAVTHPLAKRGGGAVTKNSQLARTDEVFTDHRHQSSCMLEGGLAATVDKSTAFRIERVEEGETRLSLLSGTAFFKVEKRPQPFVVATPSADAIVVGTTFQVEIEPTRTVLHVVEGTIRFKNARGEVLVQAGQRSTARANEKPTTPVKLGDVGTTVAWARRPDLLGDPKSEPWMEHAAGANKKLAGLVLTGPYADWETSGGIFAQAVSESLDVGLVLGHGHRDRAARIWMNIDRWNEEEFRADGTMMPTATTERSKKVTAEYFSHLRAAAGGVAANQPVPMIANMRVHSEQQAGQPVEVCEVAWTERSWKRQTIVELKAVYEQLLDKHKPATRIDMRFEGVDDTYMYNGVKRKFKFTESDAVSEGYLSPRHSQSAIAFFFPVSFSRRPLDASDPYAKILAEMVEWLYARRR